jgi:hypothetical protein
VVLVRVACCIVRQAADELELLADLERQQAKVELDLKVSTPTPHAHAHNMRCVSLSVLYALSASAPVGVRGHIAFCCDLARPFTCTSPSRCCLPRIWPAFGMVLPLVEQVARVGNVLEALGVQATRTELLAVRNCWRHQ